MTNGAEIEVDLSAAIIAASGHVPLILTVENDHVSAAGGPACLPSGRFDPIAHRTIEIGLRAWVGELTSLNLGYVEQLYTFGDRGRHLQADTSGAHTMSIGYLALTSLLQTDFAAPERSSAVHPSGIRWTPWYDFFPWEDWRAGRPQVLDGTLLPLLRNWACDEPDVHTSPRTFSRTERLAWAFGSEDVPWDEEKILERYELLYEAGIAEEAILDGRAAVLERKSPPVAGIPMRYDHRRILATAIARLRGKLKYRPLVFELMRETFTLTELQKTVEAISGRHLHKQNFRRLVDGSALVEPTGTSSTHTGGRPAALYRFRKDFVRERPAPGLRYGTRS